MVRLIDENLFVLLAVCLVASGCAGHEEALGPVADAKSAAAIRDVIYSAADASAATEAADAGADDATGSGWATLKGRFTFDGTPPDLPPLNANKDVETCAPGGQMPPDESLVVQGPGGGIANIAVYLRKAPRVHESAQAGDAPVVFDQKQCMFLTHVCPIVVGETLLVKNSDPVGHNTKINTARGTASNAIIAAGKSEPYRPTAEEAVPAPVSCSIHPWMTSYVLPRRDRYVAVTAADGSFEIANLPAGVRLEFQVWHERSASVTGGLVIDAPGWSKRGRFSVELDVDVTRTIEIAVPAKAFRL